MIPWLIKISELQERHIAIAAPVQPPCYPISGRQSRSEERFQKREGLHVLAEQLPECYSPAYPPRGSNADEWNGSVPASAHHREGVGTSSFDLLLVFWRGCLKPPRRWTQKQVVPRLLTLQIDLRYRFRPELSRDAGLVRPPVNHLGQSIHTCTVIL